MIDMLKILTFTDFDESGFGFYLKIYDRII